MTALGKMLAILVLLLSFVWVGFTINAYVTRTNWEAEAKRAQAKGREAADAANNMQTLLNEQRAAASDREQAQVQQIRQQAEENAELRKQIETMRQQYNDLYVAVKKDTGGENILEANRKKLQDQVDQQEKLLADREKQLNELTAQANADRVTAEKMRLDADAQRQRAERFATRIQQLTDEVQDLRRRLGDIAGRTPGTRGGPSLPENFRGTVVRRDGDLVQFTPGLDAGLREGATLKVQRPGKYVGTLTVLILDPKEGVGRFTPPAKGGRLGPDDYPKPGDELIPQ